MSPRGRLSSMETTLLVNRTLSVRRGTQPGGGARNRMQIRIGYEMVFEAPAPAPVIAMLYTHPSRAASLLAPDVLHVEPETSVTDYTDAYGNRCARFVLPAGRSRVWGDTVVTDSGQ